MASQLVPAARHGSGHAACNTPTSTEPSQLSLSKLSCGCGLRCLPSCPRALARLPRRTINSDSRPAGKHLIDVVFSITHQRRTVQPLAACPSCTVSSRFLCQEGLLPPRFGLLRRVRIRAPDPAFLAIGIHLDSGMNKESWVLPSRPAPPRPRWRAGVVVLGCILRHRQRRLTQAAAVRRAATDRLPRA
jgi:hypothetical protein